MLCEWTGFYVFLKWNFYIKIDFKIQTCLFTVPPSSPRILNVDTNDAVGCSHMRSHAYSASLRPAGDLANYQQNWEFWECWYIARGDLLAENRAM